MTRAKYFIRDEFLVSRDCLWFPLPACSLILRGVSFLTSKFGDQTIQFLSVISPIVSMNLAFVPLNLGLF